MWRTERDGEINALYVFVRRSSRVRLARMCPVFGTRWLHVDRVDQTTNRLRTVYSDTLMLENSQRIEPSSFFQLRLTC
jgi:hypothetical protein